jgi:autonomous glycyl radical cofactor GrcA
MNLPTWAYIAAPALPSGPNWVEVTALIVAVLAFLAAGASALFTYWQHKDSQAEIREAQAQTKHAENSVKLAERQTDYAARQLELAEELRRDQVQPYLLAEIDSSIREAQLLVLRISNAGMTTAHNVKATVKPRLTMESGQHIGVVDISTLAPGGVWERMISTKHAYLENKDLPRSFTIKISGDGPFGPVETDECRIDLNELAPKVNIDADGVRIAKSLKSMEGHLEALRDMSSWWKQRQTGRDNQK